MPATLPDDILLAIFCHLTLGDIPHLRVVSKEVARLSKAATLWKHLLQITVSQRRLPVKGLDAISLEQLQGFEIEGLLRCAVDLQSNWTSPTPQARNTAHFASTHASGFVILLEFIRQPGCSWLLSVTLQDNGAVLDQRQLVMECWDLTTGSPPICVARTMLQQAPSIAVNQDPSVSTSHGHVAIGSSTIAIYCIRPFPENPENGFARVREFSNIGRLLHFFSGTRIVSTDDSGQRIFAWDVRNPDGAIELSQLSQMTRSIRAATWSGRYVVLATARACVTYTLPEDVVNPRAPPHTLFPTNEWEWQSNRSAYEVVLSQLRFPRVRPSSISTLQPPSAISFLIRFASGYPWPANLLHHYELRPSTSTTNLALEYHCPPTLRRTIASPTRLLARTDMVMGPYNTAMWIDNHTEDHFEHGQQAQRLASQVLAPLGGADLESEASNEESDPEEEERVVSTLDVSVMSWNEKDSWTKIAVHEEEGRIALGHATGEITLVSYSE